MRRSLTALALAAALLAACSLPKYVTYTSIHKDWRASVPWAWNVITDDEQDHYCSTTFLGAFDPNFFLGLPSLSVRWYSYSEPHRLRDGSLELYSSADDFIRQTLGSVYARQQTMIQPVHDISLSGGVSAKHFVVLSPAPVPAGTRWGTSRDAQTGQPVNLRQHAYVVVPLARGFYVLTYPATRDGYKLYERRFNELVNSFVAVTDGPSGPRRSSGVPLAAAR